MDTKILVLLLLGVSLLAFGCAGKKAEAPPTMGPANDSAMGGDAMEDDGAMDSGSNTTMESNGSMENDEMESGTMDDDDGAMDDDDGAMDDGSANASGKDLSDLADLFKVDTDKPLEDEGFDVKSVDSNES